MLLFECVFETEDFKKCAEVFELLNCFEVVLELEIICAHTIVAIVNNLFKAAHQSEPLNSWQSSFENVGDNAFIAGPILFKNIYQRFELELVCLDV